MQFFRDEEDITQGETYHTCARGTCNNSNLYCFAEGANREMRFSLTTIKARQLSDFILLRSVKNLI